MSAKTKSQRLRRLISHGYFAPELPPCFVSENLARRRQSILAGIDALPVDRRGRPHHYGFISKPAYFYFPRFGKDDRRHGVPNPIAHLLLSRVLANNYIDLRRRARASQLTLSPPTLDWSGSRALVRTSVNLRDDFRVNLSSRREEYVAADVRAFFHTIYTHAIPWAIHGKEFAKQNRGPSHYGNLIDLLCRNAQDGQTVGLPVGPDTSRLIAEVVASSVDKHLREHLNVGHRDASRYIDDYTLSSPNGERAEELLAALRQSAAVFELELNNEKSGVYSTSQRQDIGWQHAALAHLPRTPRGGTVTTKLLEHFFYELGRVCIAHPDINVEKFGLQNARSALVNAESWPPILFSLINAYRRNASLLPLLVEICLLRHARGGDALTKDLVEFVSNRIPFLARANRTGEIIWLLFLAMRLRLSLPATQFRHVFSIENGFIALLVVCLDAQGLIRGSVDRTTWDQSLTGEGLQGSMWLYAYESVGQGFLPQVNDDFISQHQYFGLLKKNKVRFLDITRGYLSIESTLRSLRDENERIMRVLYAIHNRNIGDEIDFDELDDLYQDQYEEQSVDIY